jgi:hypothetical protein
MEPANESLAHHLAGNIYAHALRSTAGNANAEVRLDTRTRPKIIKPKKGMKSYRRSHSKQWRETGSTGPSP